MPPAKQTIPNYTLRLYELIDVLDVVASNRGDRAVEPDADRLLGQVVKAYPKAAEMQLGKPRVAQLVARYKAAADPLDQLGQRFLALLREAGDDEARAWLEGAITEMQADDGEEPPPPAGVGKVSSSGDQSKAVQKAAPPSLWAAAVRGELGESDMRPR